MNIGLSADSSIDLPKELLNKYNINVIPFTITMNDKIYKDGDFEQDVLFKFVRDNKVIPKTSAINEIEFIDYFNDLKKDYDAIIHVSISSQASSAYFNAVRASQSVDNVFVIDSKNICSGVALLAIYIRSLIDNNEYIDEIINKANKRIPDIHTNFITDNLYYLHKSGRVSGLIALASNILKIHPQIYMNDGKTYCGKKYRGKLENVFDQYFKDIIDQYPNPDLSVGFVSYTSCSQTIIQKGINALKNIGFKIIHVIRTGLTVSCHCGENCLGLLFMNKNFI